METLLQFINYDVADYIIKIVEQDIKSECTELYKQYKMDKTNLPPEPISGRLYQAWLNQMIDFTYKTKPLNTEIEWYLKEIHNCKDFNVLNSILYLDFKDIIKEWYELKSFLSLLNKHEL